MPKVRGRGEDSEHGDPSLLGLEAEADAGWGYDACMGCRCDILLHDVLLVDSSVEHLSTTRISVVAYRESRSITVVSDAAALNAWHCRLRIHPPRSRVSAIPLRAID